MNKSEKYRRASLACMTPAELDAAKRNFARSAERFPEEHRRVAILLKERELENHREVLLHYSRAVTPIPIRELNYIEIYKDTTYAGPHGQGQQYGEATHAQAGAEQTAADRIFRQAIKPDGAE